TNCGVPVKNWKVSSNLQITSFDDKSVTVKFINPGSNGSAYIEAILPHDTAKRFIQVGFPYNHSAYIKSNIAIYPHSATPIIISPPIDSAYEMVYHWEISSLSSGCNEAYFQDSGTNTFSSSANQAIIWWGTCSGAYRIKC